MTGTPLMRTDKYKKLKAKQDKLNDELDKISKKIKDIRAKSNKKSSRISNIDVDQSILDDIDW